MLRRLLRRALHCLGYEIRRIDDDRLPRDLDARTRTIFERVRPYTMTSVERTMAMCQAVRHVVHHGIPGAIVECGVWKGGSMMAAALTLIEEGAADRPLWLYDTFEGMTAPGEHDVSLDGVAAAEEWRRQAGDGAWCHASQEEVAGALASTVYPGEVVMVPGRLEDTLPAHAPQQIALLRLDVDWYEPTRHALEHLYPLLSPGGLLILDDHGHWQGARQAAEEFFAATGQTVFLARIDYTGRIAVKSPG